MAKQEPEDGGAAGLVEPQVMQQDSVDSTWGMDGDGVLREREGEGTRIGM